MSFTKSEKITLIVLAIIVMAVVAYTVSLLVNRLTSNADSPAAQALATAVDQTPYTTLSGENMPLEQLFGEALVVNTWASWSPYAAQELPQLVALAEEFADKEIRFVAINRGESRSMAQRYLRHLDLSEEDLIFVLDGDDRFFDTIGGYAVPETMFYDRSGNIVHHARGSLTGEEMRFYVEQALSAEAE